MILEFERGEASRPKGHALAYVRSQNAPDEIYATYLIVPPIPINLAKYMPPMFSEKLSMADVESVAAIPLPPLPERVESRAYLDGIADLRGDDIVYLGTIDTADVQHMLIQVGEAAQQYLQAYTAAIEAAAPLATAGSPQPLPESVDEVLYTFMSDRDKLGELAKLLGKFRYALDGNDDSLAQETLREIGSVATHLPEKYHVNRLTQAAEVTAEKGSKLLELHLLRCYRICDEDYLSLEQVEREIRELEASS